MCGGYLVVSDSPLIKVLSGNALLVQSMDEVGEWNVKLTLLQKTTAKSVSEEIKVTVVDCKPSGFKLSTN